MLTLHATIHGWYLVRAMAANGGMKGLGYPSAVWLIEKKHLLKQLAEFTHEKAGQAELWSKVRPEQVELRSPQLALESLSSDRFKLSGSIKNVSSQQVGAFEIEVTARDRADKCEIIGHATDIMWVDVPPQQVRGISGVVILANLPQLRGKFTSQFVVKRVYAGDMLDAWNVTKN